MSHLELTAAHAYAEYCHRVYVADRTWPQWEALPAYLRRAWIASVKVAIEMQAGRGR